MLGASSPCFCWAASPKNRSPRHSLKPRTTLSTTFRHRFNPTTSTSPRSVVVTSPRPHLGPDWRTRRRCARPPTATGSGAVTMTTTTPRTSPRTALPNGEADGGSRSGRLRQSRWLPLVGPDSTPTRGSASVGVLPEPIHGRRAGVEDQDVSVVWTQQ